jgi:pyridinium-3,5-biscarboxylic acid mononucleotide sulfurtransferase
LINLDFLKKLSADELAAWQRLTEYLKAYPPAVVAFSGGVDSGLLAAAQYLISGDKMLAVMVDSPVHTDEDRSAAKALAKQVGFNLEILLFDDLQNEAFCLNPVDRCYICKYERFKHLLQYAHEYGYHAVMEGSNLDDESDYRPGKRAVQELGIRSPLATCGIPKNQIRSIAKAMGLSVWDRPSKPCLATRIPYGVGIDREKLSMVQQAETYLADSGFNQIRVRSDGKTAKIEVEPEQLSAVLDERNNIIMHFRQLGFVYITLDLEGYRLGSANEGIQK